MTTCWATALALYERADRRPGVSPRRVVAGRRAGEGSATDGRCGGAGRAIVCFPEAYLPGLRGQDFDVPPFYAADQQRVLDTVSALGAHVRDCRHPRHGAHRRRWGRQIAAFVIDADGRLQGVQTKNQLDPTEDPFYVPGDTRQIFEVNGVKFGIAICHEGWRYPETVRWAATRGAKIVFHPQLTGTHANGPALTTCGSPDAPYYEKAMMCRSIENGIYFASVNYAVPFQESATALIDPTGSCQAYLPYGQEGVLVQPIDTELATGLLASRYAPERYRESPRPPAVQSSSPLDHASRRRGYWRHVLFPERAMRPDEIDPLACCHLLVLSAWSTSSTRRKKATRACCSPRHR